MQQNYKTCYISYKTGLKIVVALSIIMLIPFLGLADFNSKGEPREAVVAYTMLEHGNWILPINNGGDIPYKPPFFHWCIALCSLITGHVSEYTSRLPSALALIALTIGTFKFFCREEFAYDGNSTRAILTSVLLLTSFEVHRAGGNCRVDMVLTFFIVEAIYLLFGWWRDTVVDKEISVPWLAVLCMSLGTLTKGPIAIILPCLTIGIYMLSEDNRPYSYTFKAIFITGGLSMFIPLVWYIAALDQGGFAFLNLVLEENFGRIMGKMTYESHENPAWYNVITLIAGWLPYTLLFLVSLFFLPWKKRFSKEKFIFEIKNADFAQKYIWIAFFVVFIFYCIPKSKRSVYLLPCYPFMAFLITEYIIWLIDINKVIVLKIYAWIIAGLIILLNVAFLAIKMEWIPESIFHGKHAADNITMLHALRDCSLFPSILFVIITLAGVYFIFKMLSKKEPVYFIPAILGSIVGIYMFLDSSLQPAVLNTKADKYLAPVIEKKFGTDNLYSYLPIDMLHFFSLNFYLGDKIQQFEKVNPKSGILMIPKSSAAKFIDRYPWYSFKKAWEVNKVVEWHDTIEFYRFHELPIDIEAIREGEILQQMSGHRHGR